jgi:hypothetical protein
MAYVIDPRAHASDRTVTYSYAEDLLENVRKACSVGRTRPVEAPEEDGFGEV